MMLCRFREALEDSQQAVRLDDCFMKVRFNRFSPLTCLQTLAVLAEQRLKSRLYSVNKQV